MVCLCCSVTAPYRNTLDFLSACKLPDILGSSLLEPRALSKDSAFWTSGSVCLNMVGSQCTVSLNTVLGGTITKWYKHTEI